MNEAMHTAAPMTTRRDMAMCARLFPTDGLASMSCLYRQLAVIRATRVQFGVKHGRQVAFCAPKVALFFGTIWSPAAREDANPTDDVIEVRLRRLKIRGKGATNLVFIAD